MTGNPEESPSGGPEIRTNIKSRRLEGGFYGFRFFVYGEFTTSLKDNSRKTATRGERGWLPPPSTQPPPSEEEVIFLELHQTTTKWCVDCTNNQFLSMNQLVIVAGASSSLPSPPLTVPKLVKMPIFLVGWLVGWLVSWMLHEVDFWFLFYDRICLKKASDK